MTMASSVDNNAPHDDVASVQSSLYRDEEEGPPPPPPAVPSPDRREDDDDAAVQAEVSLMQTNTRRSTDPTADQAVMGAAEQDNFVILDENGEIVKTRFLDFLLEYRQLLEQDGEQQYCFPYVQQALQMVKRQQNEEGEGERGVFASTLLVDFQHVLNHDFELAEAIQGEYVRFEPFLQQATRLLVQHEHPELEDAQLYFVAFFNLPQTLKLRKLLMDRVGTLCSIEGTITRTSEVRPELLVGAFSCNKCGLEASHVRQQFHYTHPTLCRNPRCGNTSPNEFTLLTQASQFCDWQKLRVQENSSEIPPGSMPRSINVICRNEMVERSKAGDKCVFFGSLVVIPDGSALSRSGEPPRRITEQEGGGVRGLAACGVKELTYKTCFVACCVLQADAIHHNNSINVMFGRDAQKEPTAQEIIMGFTQEEKEEIRSMRASPGLYQQMAQSIAPTTFGHTEVKRGILLMLLGGVHKTTAEGMRLRGDINVCIVGDPSTAKSQFLKYVHSFLPNQTVYTSGKASSAAGLTAAVQRDQDTGEHCIEAGALMLADNGICCIDEFDKMDPTDQVAIHEAMEQQTISITKAGIQATLNARASILAAANPIYGRYDRTKTLKANVSLSAPILSRFDLFFVVLDECNEIADQSVAEHILNVHRCMDEAVTPPFTMDQMRRYISFAKTLCPKLTAESQRVLVECYRKLRQGDTLGRSRTAYRITVRQLESMIRLSEALARLHCEDEIQPAHVREAFRLLRKSIIHVETEDVTFETEEDDEEDEEPPSGDATDEPPNHPGEYNPNQEMEGQEEEGQQEEEVSNSQDTTTPAEPVEKKKVKKTQITFEQFEAISTAIATYLRSLEQDHEAGEEKEEGSKSEVAKHLTWGEVVEWYLEQCEEQIGDSVEELKRMKKLTNLVIRRLIDVDRVLICIGDVPKSKDEEQKTRIAVHPNYVMS